MHKKLISWAILPIISLSLIIIAARSPYTISDDDYFSAVSNHNKVTSVRIPASLSFANEPLPLEKQYVREAIEHELIVNTYWHSSSILIIKRAHRWFPVIEPILKEYGIPDDFKYLAVAESGLRNVVSPAGAKGFWQIMKSTGREYGLEINSGIDERYHVEKSTRVACEYLLNSYEEYDSWTLAAASYNAGMNGITKEIQKQNAKTYYDMNLGEETGRYIYRIVALKELLSRPEDFGFKLRDKDLYQPYNTYEISVDTTIHNLADFAALYGMNYKELKVYNPWLRQSDMPDKSRRTYQIKIPK